MISRKDLFAASYAACASLDRDSLIRAVFGDVERGRQDFRQTEAWSFAPPGFLRSQARPMTAGPPRNMASRWSISDWNIRRPRRISCQALLRQQP